jgi:hypothetical protein
VVVAAVRGARGVDAVDANDLGVRRLISATVRSHTARL